MLKQQPHPPHLSNKYSSCRPAFKITFGYDPISVYLEQSHTIWQFLWWSPQRKQSSCSVEYHSTFWIFGWSILQCCFYFSRSRFATEWKLVLSNWRPSITLPVFKREMKGLICFSKGHLFSSLSFFLSHQVSSSQATFPCLLCSYLHIPVLKTSPPCLEAASK